MSDLGRWIKKIEAGDFSGAYRAALAARGRRNAQRMSSSETLPRRSTRELIARRAPTVATSNPS
jgi:hypothetical protein